MSDPAPTEASSAELFGSNRMWGLKEIELPEPVSWWPQTTGWVVLGVILLGIVAWVGWRYWQRYQHDFYRRDGLQKLEQFAHDPTKITELPQLLRISALKAAPRADVASLRGSHWTNWLNSSAQDQLFEDGDAKLLDDLAFAPFVPSSIDDNKRRHLIDAAKAWMGSHHASV